MWIKSGSNNGLSREQRRQALFVFGDRAGQALARRCASASTSAYEQLASKPHCARRTLCGFAVWQRRDVASSPCLFSSCACYFLCNRQTGWCAFYPRRTLRTHRCVSCARMRRRGWDKSYRDLPSSLASQRMTCSCCRCLSADNMFSRRARVYRASSFWTFRDARLRTRARFLCAFAHIYKRACFLFRVFCARTRIRHEGVAYGGKRDQQNG